MNEAEERHFCCRFEHLRVECIMYELCVDRILGCLQHGEHDLEHWLERVHATLECREGVVSKMMKELHPFGQTESDMLQSRRVLDHSFGKHTINGLCDWRTVKLAQNPSLRSGRIFPRCLRRMPLSSLHGSSVNRVSFVSDASESGFDDFELDVGEKSRSLDDLFAASTSASSDSTTFPSANSAAVTTSVSASSFSTSGGTREDVDIYEHSPSTSSRTRRRESWIKLTDTDYCDRQEKEQMARNAKRRFESWMMDDQLVMSLCILDDYYRLRECLEVDWERIAMPLLLFDSSRCIAEVFKSHPERFTKQLLDLAAEVAGLSTFKLVSDLCGGKYDEDTLDASARGNNLAVARYLLCNKCKVDWKCMATAARAGNAEFVRALVDRGVRACHVAISNAVMSGNVCLLKYLLHRFSRDVDEVHAQLILRCLPASPTAPGLFWQCTRAFPGSRQT